jgi:hypothetical protein
MSSEVLQVAILVSKSQAAAQDLSRKLGLSFGRISSVSTLSCASAASFDSPPRSPLRKPFSVPVIKVSSSTSSDFLFLEPGSSLKGVHLSLLPALPESANVTGNNAVGEASLEDDSLDDDQDSLYSDIALACRSPATTASAVNCFSNGTLGIGSSSEEVTGDVQLEVTVDKLPKNSTAELSVGYISRSRYKIINELESLAYIVKTLDVPPRASAETPSIVVTEDALTDRAATRQNEDMPVYPVYGLGIHLPRDDQEGREVYKEKGYGHLRKTRSVSEPSSSLRRRFHHALDSLHKPFVKREETLSPKRPKGTPPSPTNWMSALSSSGRSWTALPGSHQGSLPLQHLVPVKQNKSAPSSPIGSLFVMSGDFIRRSFDVITPHPRLSSLRTSLPVSSQDGAPLSSPPGALSGLSSTVKFLSLRDLNRRR